MVTTTVILVAGLAGGFGAVGVASVRGWASPLRIIGFFVDSLRRFPVHLSNAPRLARQLVCVLATTLSFAVQLYLLAIGLGVALPPIVAIAYAPLISLAQVVPFLYGGYGVCGGSGRRAARRELGVARRGPRARPGDRRHE